jgi:hypothetical protein
MHGTVSSAFSILLGECRPQHLRQEFCCGTLMIGACFAHPQTAPSASGLNGFALRRAENKFEEVLKHTAAPDAPAPGLTRCPKV